MIANPDLPDMGFVGFNSSFCTVLCAEMAANWLVRYCDGQLANQPTAAEMHKNMDMMLHFRRVERPAAGVYGGLCVAPYHFKHFDELLADMGANGAPTKSAGGKIHAARCGRLWAVPGLGPAIQRRAGLSWMVDVRCSIRRACRADGAISAQTQKSARTAWHSPAIPRD